DPVPELWKSLFSTFQTVSDKPVFFQQPTDRFIRETFVGVVGGVRQSLVILLLLSILLVIREHLSSSNLFKGLVFCVIAGDLLWNAWGFFQFTFPYPVSGFGPEIREYLHRQPGPFRIVTPYCLAQNDALIERYETVSGYDTLVWSAYSEFINVSQGRARQEPTLSFEALHPSPLLDLLNPRFWIYPRAAATAPAPLELRLTTSDWTLYENPRAFPRFYAVSSARVLPDRASVLHQLTTTDLARTVLLETDRVCPSGSEEKGSSPLQVSILDWQPARQSLQVTLASSAYFICGDVNFPGWQATVDGVATPVMTGNGLFRTLWLEAGSHRIEFRYAPTSLRRGLCVSVISFLLWLMAVSRLLWLRCRHTPPVDH
ncbi:MAG TPA: hypothetical protein PKO06_03260, partial [Candidatus Ozemobacteraceae bacterium]|nr:hypothetical protein [Candidatus Ozemobacteraceae bacterium]